MSDMLLLGAGASKDAGLPDAFELTQRVMDWAVEAGDELTARVLSFIAGGLLFHAARNGSNPFGAKMDSESVYRALDLLANRKEAELAASSPAGRPELRNLSDDGTTRLSWRKSVS